MVVLVVLVVLIASGGEKVVGRWAAAGGAKRTGVRGILVAWLIGLFAWALLSLCVVLIRIQMAYIDAGGFQKGMVAVAAWTQEVKPSFYAREGQCAAVLLPALALSAPLAIVVLWNVNLRSSSLLLLPTSAVLTAPLVAMRDGAAHAALALAFSAIVASAVVHSVWVITDAAWGALARRTTDERCRGDGGR